MGVQSKESFSSKKEDRREEISTHVDIEKQLDNQDDSTYTPHTILSLLIRRHSHMTTATARWMGVSAKG